MLTGRGLRVGVLCFAVGLLAPALGANERGFKLIVNAANPVERLPRRTVEQFFIPKRLARWPDGNPVEPVDLPNNSDVRQAFSLAVLQKTVNRVHRYWQGRIFSGRGVPPPQRSGSEEVLQFVKARPSAIGYVASETVLVPGVKELIVDY